MSDPAMLICCYEFYGHSSCSSEVNSTGVLLCLYTQPLIHIYQLCPSQSLQTAVTFTQMALALWIGLYIFDYKAKHSSDDMHAALSMI